MRREEGLEQAAACLPRELRIAVLATGADKTVEEVRLRAGRGLFLTLGSGREEQVIVGGAPIPVTGDDLSLTVELATRASFQVAAEQVRRGFLPLKGGHRLGLCGTVNVQGGEITGIRELSSLAVRVARPVPGFGRAVTEGMVQGRRVKSTLILSPPGYGKTTLLRDTLRLLSEERRLRIGLADERGEVAGLWRGVPQLDVGPTTDVLDGCPKAQGLLTLLRGMNPQVLAADEITAPQDVEALTQAANCGVALVATAHAAGLEDLKRRPLYKRMLAQRCFERICVIERRGAGRTCRLEALP